MFRFDIGVGAPGIVQFLVNGSVDRELSSDETRALSKECLKEGGLDWWPGPLETRPDSKKIADALIQASYNAEGRMPPEFRHTFFFIAAVCGAVVVACLALCSFFENESPWMVGALIVATLAASGVMIALRNALIPSPEIQRWWYEMCARQNAYD